MAGDLSRVIFYSSFNYCFLQLQKNQTLCFLKNLFFQEISVSVTIS